MRRGVFLENTTENKKVIFSGVQPSGNLTIGNYLGALKIGLNYKMNMTVIIVLLIYMQ